MSMMIIRKKTAILLMALAMLCLCAFPASSADLHERAKNLYDVGDYRASLNLYERILAADPEDGLAWDLSAWCLRYLGEWESAEANYKKALILLKGEDVVWSLIGLGELYLDAMMYEDSLLRLRDALNIAGDNEEAFERASRNIESVMRGMEANAGVPPPSGIVDSAERQRELLASAAESDDVGESGVDVSLIKEAVIELLSEIPETESEKPEPGPIEPEIEPTPEAPEIEPEKPEPAPVEPVIEPMPEAPETEPEKPEPAPVESVIETTPEEPEAEPEKPEPAPIEPVIETTPEAPKTEPEKPAPSPGPEPSAPSSVEHETVFGIKLNSPINEAVEILNSRGVAVSGPPFTRTGREYLAFDGEYIPVPGAIINGALSKRCYLVSHDGLVMSVNVEMDYDSSRALDELTASVRDEIPALIGGRTARGLRVAENIFTNEINFAVTGTYGLWIVVTDKGNGTCRVEIQHIDLHGLSKYLKL